SHSRKEGVDHLHLNGDKVINISTAVGPEFRKIAIDEREKTALYKDLGLTRAFLLYTGGGDERKNLSRLIQAYAYLPRDLRNAYQLVLAGRILQNEVVRLQRLATECGLSEDDLIFAGHVTDQQLLNLFNLCTLYVLPS